MDALAGLLDGPRARGAFLLRSVLEPPWSLRVQDEAPLTLVAVVEGEAWVMYDGDDPARLAAGDVALLRGPRHYTVADDPATPPTVVIHPGQRCTTPDGEPLTDAMNLGVRTWGNSPAGSTVMVTGTYGTRGATSQRVLDALPELVVLPGGPGDSPLMGMLAAEVVRDEPGQVVVLDRLLDLLLVAALRTWFSRPRAEAPGWYRAATDPVVGPALRVLQHDPARPWTVATLAAEVGVSRALLARRFTELVGEPPMTFLTGQRLAMAADLLTDPHVTVAAVARQVGYGSAFALSAAFKRERGVSPQQYRANTTRRASP
ncbi:AraC-type DNA-binding protein [Streptoalloteichus tenebrarius]|uniref:AraC-type DNA-binding protein n=1 Tax=Streptoalloteichus tenebrarius (strain ATCC 17920 / DSM 40477 / JCM 4838 / CBS 697.72 / NBRC 16177 / NCIMB 11028 / NRRL B-12390 / A12253. 1 / ISP 5477) TaxID=1933 RepID=A0ABT1HMA8_STRSD|nr:AraC family transcriptional regulator [Streptoalloteichus tenebrarius]MCP2256652.1 AraC-type DNA-binding protein [Streptoalloteichus tenebrarius]